jgi:hypothetical protein
MYTKNPYIIRVFCILVAGPGIEPGSSGYEPDEVPLLYPAITPLLVHPLYQLTSKKASISSRPVYNSTL